MTTEELAGPALPNPFVSSGAQLAFEGMTRALVAPDEQSLQDAQITIGQGLFWAISLDDRLARRHGGVGYRRIRDTDQEGRYMEGARLARNAITHGAVVMQSLQGGLAFPLQFPLSFGGFRWRPLEEVLAEWTDRIEPPKAQLASYGAFFPGLQPTVPIAMAANWLRPAPTLGFDL